MGPDRYHRQGSHQVYQLLHQNLFYPNSYRGLIPQGEGQQFTISAQTNARYYQAYSISFLDPWFGGKRPNSLSVSAYYSRQTGVNSSYYSNRYMNYYNSYYSGLYNGYGYGYNDYYNNAIEDAYDPNKYLQMLGVNIGFGKRLDWPDNWFTFQAELGYNWYHVKNWAYLLNMQNGTSNSLVLGLTLSRNSIDNPQYTRTGSIFSLNLQLTPPASLFGKRTGRNSRSKTPTKPTASSTAGSNTGNCALPRAPTLRSPIPTANTHSCS